MLITWMAYATLIGAAVSVAAIAIEQIVAIWNGARRVVWLAALVASIVLPLTVAFATRSPASVDSTASDAARITLSGAPLSPRASSVISQHSAADAILGAIPKLEQATPLAWLTISVLLFGLFLRADLILRGRRAEWRRAIVDGHPVLVARDVGPAVVGAIRSRIVFPEWALGLDADERMLMLQHEREHVAARDPLLLMAAGLAVICLPWNAAMWFMARRLRLAIEIDCDARVLRAVNRPREYGMLLLAVGARNAATLPYAASLAERRPLLERRIRAMTSIRPTHPVFASVMLGVVAVATTAFAAQAPRPEPIVVASMHAAQANRVSSPVTKPVTNAMRAMDVDTLRPRDAVLHVAASSAAGVQLIPEMRNWATNLAGLSPRVTPSAMQIVPIQAAAPPLNGDIPFATIRAWIAKYQPEIASGQSTAALVTIIVDASDNYVSSTTDASPTSSNSAGKIPVDSIATIEVIKGPAAIAAYGNQAANGVIIVSTKGDHSRTAPRDSILRNYLNGVRTDAPANQVQLRPGVSIRRQDGPLYVIDGVVVESLDPIAKPADQLDKLGIPSDGIQSVQVLRAPAGSAAPTALSVVIVKLKP